MSAIDPLLNQLKYSNRQRVKDDIHKVILEYRTLAPKIVDYVHDNGDQTKLIVLAGTIPIMYNGVQYNIPVDLFVCENHPREAPKLYVRPTSNMTVKQNHQHVSPNGLCYLPYIHEWGPSSHLVGLVEIASSVFSIEPPLFAKPPPGTVAASSSSSSSITQSAQYGATAVTRSSPAPHTAGARTGPAAMAATTASPVSALPAVATAYSSNAYESYTPVMATVSPATTAAAASSSGATASSYSAAATMATPASVAQISASMSSSSLRSEEEKRLQLIDQVTMRLYEAVDNKQRTLRDELDTQIALGASLEQSGQAAQRALTDLRQSRGLYTEALATLTQQSAEFDAWSAEEGSRPAPPVTERLVPFDALSAQITRLSAEAQAIDDAFYYLERALASSRNTTVDLSTFLKECRQLGRRQFLCKAHLRKISAEAMQREAEKAGQQARGVPIPMANGYGQQAARSGQPQPQW